MIPAEPQPDTPRSEIKHQVRPRCRGECPRAELPTIGIRPAGGPHWHRRPRANSSLEISSHALVSANPYPWPTTRNGWCRLALVIAGGQCQFVDPPAAPTSPAGNEIDAVRSSGGWLCTFATAPAHVDHASPPRRHTRRSPRPRRTAGHALRLPSPPTAGSPRACPMRLISLSTEGLDGCYGSLLEHELQNPAATASGSPATPAKSLSTHGPHPQ